MLQCQEGSVWLILDISCPCGCATDKKFGRIQPEQQAAPKPRLSDSGNFSILKTFPKVKHVFTAPHKYRVV
jgi:hypothetical protein